MNVTFDFSGKVAVVTGGASGIGRATVLMLAQAGAKVVLCDINDSEGADLARMSRQHARDVVFLKTDVADDQSVTEAGSFVSEEFDHIDFLVNNAGIEYNSDGNLLTMPWDKLRHILEVNFWGYVRMARAFMPLMRNDGRVVNVSSIQALAAHSPGTNYQATKAAILGFSKALALEVAERGILVNTVLPGGIATEGMGAVRAEDPNILNPYREQILLGRRGHPKEVAMAILFLLSEAASYVTGTELVVDGGWRANLNPNKGMVRQPVLNDPDR